MSIQLAIKIAGILSRLWYLQELGVGAIWLSPFFKSPMKDFGYDVSDYREVDPLFGTVGDFDSIVQRAHQLGILFFLFHIFSQYFFICVSNLNTSKGLQGTGAIRTRILPSKPNREIPGNLNYK